MNRFLEQKERGEIVLFSELLTDIPSDDVLLELFPNTFSPNKPLVTHRGLEVLKLRLEGLRQSEIAERLGLKRGQVTYASTTTKNCLHGNIPPYIDVDIPSLRRILGIQQKERTGYILLSELLRDMPSNEELLNLFVERGNIIRAGGKPPPTNQDLRLLQMRSENQSYESIGKEIGMDAGDVRHQISLTLMRIRRDLQIEADVPELYWPRKPSSQADQAQTPAPRPKNLDVLSEAQREVWVLYEQGLKRKEIAQRIGITYSTVAQHIRRAERRFREYANYCAVKERNQEFAYLPLTRGEVKIIFEALEVYGRKLERKIWHRPDSDWEGLRPYKADIVSDLQERARKVILSEYLDKTKKDLGT